MTALLKPASAGFVVLGYRKVSRDDPEQSENSEMANLENT